MIFKIPGLRIIFPWFLHVFQGQSQNSRVFRCVGTLLFSHSSQSSRLHVWQFLQSSRLQLSEFANRVKNSFSPNHGHQMLFSLTFQNLAFQHLERPEQVFLHTTKELSLNRWREELTELGIDTWHRYFVPPMRKGTDTISQRESSLLQTRAFYQSSCHLIPIPFFLTNYTLYPVSLISSLVNTASTHENTHKNLVRAKAEQPTPPLPPHNMTLPHDNPCWWQ